MGRGRIFSCLKRGSVWALYEADVKILMADVRRGGLDGDSSDSSDADLRLRVIAGHKMLCKRDKQSLVDVQGRYAAAMAGLDDATRSKLIQLMGSLRQGAAGNLQQMGTQNLQLGQQGNVDAGLEYMKREGVDFQ